MPCWCMMLSDGPTAFGMRRRGSGAFSFAWVAFLVASIPSTPTSGCLSAPPSGKCSPAARMAPSPLPTSAHESNVAGGLKHGFESGPHHGLIIGDHGSELLHGGGGA